MSDALDTSHTRSHLPHGWVLILLIMGAQFLVLMVGSLWFSAWAREYHSHLIRGEILSNNQHIAAQFANVIQQMNLSDLNVGSPDWLRLQRVVEKTRLPNQGFLCVIDAGDGRVLCHPDMLTNPAIRSDDPGKLLLHGNGDEKPLLQAAAESPDGTAGWVMMKDGVHLVGIRNLPELNAKILAHQREAGVAAAIERSVAPIRQLGLPVTCMVVLLTGLLTWYIVNRYERRFANFATGLENMVERRGRALMKTRDAVIFGLAKLAESRDDETGRHLERIRAYVEILASELSKTQPELDENAIEMIGLTSALHDIGKVGIPDRVLLKPGRFTAEEREIMKKHPLIAGDCLMAIKERLGDDDFLETACEIAFGHHERWDGDGYPFGLRGEQIPLAARIVAVADVYDALRSERIYKAAMSHEDAIMAIVRGAGSQFDPAVVAALVLRDDDFRRKSDEEADIARRSRSVNRDQTQAGKDAPTVNPWANQRR